MKTVDNARRFQDEEDAQSTMLTESRRHDGVRAREEELRRLIVKALCLRLARRATDGESE